MKRKRYWIAICVAVLLVGVWCFAHWNINRLMEENYGFEREEEYGIGDTVVLGENIVDYEAFPGYAVRVDSARVLTLDEVFEEYGEITLENPPERVADVEVTLFNQESDSTETGIFFGDLRLQHISMYTSMDQDLTTWANEFLRDQPGTFGLIIEKGKACTVHLIYDLPQSSFGYLDWATMDPSDFYLRVTSYPERQVVRLG